MKANLTTKYIAAIKPAEKPYEIADTKLKGLILRVQPTGKKTYICVYTRGKRSTLGSTDIITLVQARDKAKALLATYLIEGESRAVEKSKQAERTNEPQKMSLRDFVENEYGPWREANRKRAHEDLTRLKLHFYKEFGQIPMPDLTCWLLEKWRTKRIKKGIKATTLNRDIAILKAVLSKADEWGFISENPLRKFKPKATDSSAHVRFLEDDEESRLVLALKERDRELIQKRVNGNTWRLERGYALKDSLIGNQFGDHLTPMILLSMLTGLRRGELFSLEWKHIDMKKAILTVTGSNAKSGKTRYVPLNELAISILSSWQSQSNASRLIFPSKDGKVFNNVNKSWNSILERAKIESFRWHDLRHHFASKLVMSGIDLNTVRELLGHADIKMTLRYAHLAPEHKAQAVAKLSMGGF